MTTPERRGPVEVALQAENEVLLLSAGLATGADELRRLRALLARVTDWGYLLREAVNHGIFPSFYHRLADTCPEGVPPEFLSEIERLYQLHAGRNLRITAELLTILDLLESHRLPVLAFKGPVLAAVAYGDIAARQFVDLDLLVSRRDFCQVKDLLLSEGYRMDYSFTKLQERVHFKSSHDILFTHSRRTMLDVHWGFRYSRGMGLDAENILRRRISVSLQGKKVDTPAADDLLLLLCLHGSYHLWPTLASVADVARLVATQETWDWPGLMTRAEGTGLRRMLLLGLSLAQELMATALPPEVTALAERDPAVLALRQSVWDRRFAANGQDPGVIALSRFHLRTRARCQDKLNYIRWRAAVPTVVDWRWVRLPDHCYWLYFLLRPLRLALQGLVLPLLRKWKGTADLS